MRKYAFRWELLGDIQLGRPNLGSQTRLEIYRLMEYCFHDVLEEEFGTQRADEIFFKAGKLAGDFFYHNLIGDIEDFNEFVRKLQVVLREMGIGILRIESVDLERGELVLTVSEDLDCSGLPELDETVCIYDEGFLCALLENYTGKPFHVKEVDCWCTGDRTCRFHALMITS